MEMLSREELARLVARVFTPGPEDRGLAILVDLPDERVPDHPAWSDRRAMARDWAVGLEAVREDLGLERVTLAWYRNAGGNNADLPPTCVPDAGGEPPRSAADLVGRAVLPLGDLLDTHSLILAPTELSATAPLKVAARAHPFRAATMPGFLPAMIPALRVDYGEVNRRVNLLKDLCDAAGSARVQFRAGGAEHLLELDLRHRQAHASGGLFPRNGVAGNLPSGEAYIVPYEGERPGDPSRSAGTLPVQIDGELVIYEIRENRAVRVLTRGHVSDQEARRIAAEPAYANLSELGLGVLGDFGLEPTGSILLDEKLGLHIAFGRSDHFGGSVGPSAFSGPDAVVHLDRVYIPQVQPDVEVREVVLRLADGERRLMEDGRYVGVF
jgi:hypothetical protein